MKILLNTLYIFFFNKLSYYSFYLCHVIILIIIIDSELHKGVIKVICISQNMLQ